MFFEFVLFEHVQNAHWGFAVVIGWIDQPSLQQNLSANQALRRYEHKVLIRGFERPSLKDATIGWRARINRKRVFGVTLERDVATDRKKPFRSVPLVKPLVIIAVDAARKR